MMKSSSSPIRLETYTSRYGIPLRLGQALIGQESGGDDSAVSPKGAVGRMQIHLPSHPGVTAEQARDPDFAMNYGFAYLRRLKDEFGSWRLALAAYNAGPNAVRKYGGVPPYRETQNYVRSILRASGALQAPPVGASGASPREALSAGRDSGGLATFPASAQLDLEGLQMLAQGRYDPTERIQSLLQASPRADVGGGGIGSTPTAATSALTADPGKWVVLRQGADREGVSTQAPVIDFVAQLAQSFGKPLTIGTGTSHSQMTVNGRESHHWTGMAADIPATGKTLKRLGYLALMAAGMPKAEAFKAAQRGGLFNVGRYQIIFATDEGGDHHKHIHIGIRGS